MSSEISRDPSEYRPTDHSLQRAKYRGIPLELVGETIETGDVYPSHEEDCHVFKQEYEHTERPIRVVANTELHRVITVAWEYDN